MTDVAETVDPGTTKEQVEVVASLEPAEKPKSVKTVKEKRPCACQSFTLVGDTEDEVYASECELSTLSVFGQGHDARLVAFLVDGHFDGYKIRRDLNGVQHSYSTPATAVSPISDALRRKAEKATLNRADRIAKKTEVTTNRQAAKDAKLAEKAEKAALKAAEKEAAKTAKEAAGPKHVGAEVVAGSDTGDTAALAEGQARIKVGRWKYVADVDADGNATYTDGKGETVTIERDGYQILEG